MPFSHPFVILSSLLFVSCLSRTVSAPSSDTCGLERMKLSSGLEIQNSLDL